MSSSRTSSPVAPPRKVTTPLQAQAALLLRLRHPEWVRTNDLPRDLELADVEPMTAA